MKLDRNRMHYVFDTSALLDLCHDQLASHSALVASLDSTAACLYHPISLAELAENMHVEVWRDKDPNLPAGAVRDRVRVRRALLTLLHHHRQYENCQRLCGRRFLPFNVSPEFALYVAHQRSQTTLIRRSTKDGRVTVVCTMVDHNILACAAWLVRSKIPVRFVSSDQEQLGAAARLGIDWTYARDPNRRVAFPWTQP